MAKVIFFNIIIFALATTASVSLFGMERQLEVSFFNIQKHLRSDGTVWCTAEYTEDSKKLAGRHGVTLREVFSQEEIMEDSFYARWTGNQNSIKIKYINADFEKAASEEKNEFANLFERRQSVDKLFEHANKPTEKKIELKGSTALLDKIFTIHNLLGFGAAAVVVFVYCKWNYVKSLMRF
jgi:hypothetical protein